MFFKQQYYHLFMFFVKKRKLNVQFQLPPPGACTSLWHNTMLCGLSIAVCYLQWWKRAVRPPRRRILAGSRAVWQGISVEKSLFSRNWVLWFENWVGNSLDMLCASACVHTTHRDKALWIQSAVISGMA